MCFRLDKRVVPCCRRCHRLGVRVRAAGGLGSGPVAPSGILVLAHFLHLVLEGRKNLHTKLAYDNLQIKEFM